MDLAEHPITRRLVTPETHDIQKRAHGLNALCRECGSEVFAHSVKSIKKMAHFKHFEGSGPCRLKSLPPINRPLKPSENGRSIRAAFYNPDSIRFAFAACETLICGHSAHVTGNFTSSRFCELLEIADQRNVWSMKGLTPTLVPFALVANEVFNVQTSRIGKSYDMAFVFNKIGENSSRRRFNRSTAVDLSKPIYLAKHFLNDDGTFGERVIIQAPGNPYEVSEASAKALAAQKLGRFPSKHIERILKEFAPRV